MHIRHREPLLIAQPPSPLLAGLVIQLQQQPRDLLDRLHLIERVLGLRPKRRGLHFPRHALQRPVHQLGDLRDSAIIQLFGCVGRAMVVAMLPPREKQERHLLAPKRSIVTPDPHQVDPQVADQQFRCVRHAIDQRSQPGRKLAPHHKHRRQGQIAQRPPNQFRRHEQLHLFQRPRGMRHKPPRPPQQMLFQVAAQDHQRPRQRAAWLGNPPGHLQHHRHAAGIVIGPGIDLAIPHPQVVMVGAQDQDFVFQPGIGPRNAPADVPAQRRGRVARPGGTRNRLPKAPVGKQRLQPQLLEPLHQELDRLLLPRRGPPPLELGTRQLTHIVSQALQDSRSVGVVPRHRFGRADVDRR